MSMEINAFKPDNNLMRYHHFHFADGKTEAHIYLSHLPQVSELEGRRASF